MIRTRLAGVGAVALVALVGCDRVGGEPFQATHSAAIPLNGTLGQTFAPATDGIRGIDLLTATYGEAPDAGGRLVVTIRDLETGRRLGAASVGGRAIADNRWVPVRFDPPLPAPEKASLTVRWEGGTPLGLRANIPPAVLDRTEQDVNDPYPQGHLLRGSARAEGDLAFRVLGTGGAAEASAQLGGMLSAAGQRLFDRPGFALYWLALDASALALAVSGFRRRPPPTPPTPPRKAPARPQEPWWSNAGDGP